MGCSEGEEENPTFLTISKTLERTITPPTPRSDLWLSKKKKNQVFIEGYVESTPEDEEQEQGCFGSGPSRGVSRTVSLTDDDLDELKGCVDLGFGFNYEEIPELVNTLPALELCYSINQKFLGEQHKFHSSSEEEATESSVMPSDTTGASPIANWKISSPGDHPEDVKARLKFWAQAVACTVKLCS